MSAQTIRIEVGAGELIDKITILQIKSARVSDADKLRNIRHELAVLERIHAGALAPDAKLDALTDELKRINEALWDIEDDIRAHEAEGNFGESFVALARAVYQTNDRRAALKRDINTLTGATIIEEKSYTDGA